MKKTMRLSELPEGVLAEIVSLNEKTLFEKIGAHVGMHVLVLKKAMTDLVQFGIVQLEIEHEILDQIRVQPLEI